jgi:hypothetical protein
MRSDIVTPGSGSYTTYSATQSSRIFSVSTLLLLLVLPTVSLAAGAAIGPRAGYDFESDNLVLGGGGEFGRVLQSFRFAPSVEFEFGDNTVTALNGDFRLYLFPLPETGLHFYGSAGPTLVFTSRDKADTQSELGLSLVAGVKIPMKGENCYNLEARFGFGDIPEFKLMFAIFFGI